MSGQRKHVEYWDHYAYDVPQADEVPGHHGLLRQIAVRLIELDEGDGGDETGRPPAGVRVIQRLAALERKSRRAYWLVLDLLGPQRSLQESLTELGKRYEATRGQAITKQGWLQGVQDDVETISLVWPEVGHVVRQLLDRTGEGWTKGDNKDNTPGRQRYCGDRS